MNTVVAKRAKSVAYSTKPKRYAIWRKSTTAMPCHVITRCDSLNEIPSLTTRLTKRIPMTRLIRRIARNGVTLLTRMNVSLSRVQYGRLSRRKRLTLTLILIPTTMLMLIPMPILMRIHLRNQAQPRTLTQPIRIHNDVNEIK